MKKRSNMLILLNAEMETPKVWSSTSEIWGFVFHKYIDKVISCALLALCFREKKWQNKKIFLLRTLKIKFYTVNTTLGANK